MLLAVIAAAVIYMIVARFEAAANVLVVLIGFGLVVLIHEFGHFIVAKLSGIKVEAFSIGFPPYLCSILRTEKGWRIRMLPGGSGEQDSGDSDNSLFSLTVGKSCRPGETEYRIGLIPFGGFVKMLGQDDTSTGRSDDPRSYSNKPVGVRAAVIAAGVVFNALSAIIIFMVVFMVGINQVPPIVGDVYPNSPAQRAGLRPGDEIIEINGKSKSLTFSSIIMAGALSGKGEKISIKTRHEDGTVEQLSLVPEELGSIGGDLRGFGIAAAQSLTIDKLSAGDAKTLFERTGLKPGDRIISVNGKPVGTYWELAEAVENCLGPEVVLAAERVDPSTGKVEVTETTIVLEVPPAHADSNSPSNLSNICGMIPRLRITDVAAGGPQTFNQKLLALVERLLIAVGIKKEQADDSERLRPGDIIIAVGQAQYPTFAELRRVTQAHKDRELTLKVLREQPDGSRKPLTVTVVPKAGKDERVLIGIAAVLDMRHPVVADTVAVPGTGEKPQIPRGAMIEAVDGVKVSSFYDIIHQLRRNQGRSVNIEWRLNDEQAGVTTLDIGDIAEAVTASSRLSEFIPFKPLMRLYRAGGPVDAVAMGLRTTGMYIANAVVTLRRFIGRDVSASNFLGPVGILKISYKIVEQYPLVQYVYFLGLISAFIAVFNALPLLPFDGGHIVFLAAEKIKGSPVSERVHGVALYIGLVLVATLVMYVTVNDIFR